MARYRKRPVIVDAFQWTGANVESLARWACSIDLAHKKHAYTSCSKPPRAMIALRR